jgi:hypothetical protein
VRRAAPFLLAAWLLAGCGTGGTKGTASVWVTRDRGAKVILVRGVPAGLTAMQALERVARVKSRYGGRFVQSIEGIAGSASALRDWLYFVNGYEADRGAAEYRLRPGDVEWWDYRSWSGGAIHVPVAVGAFPEPFLHGYDGKRRPTIVYGDPAAGRAVAKVVRGRYAGRSGPDLPGANTFVVGSGRPLFTAHAPSAGGRVKAVFHGDWHALLRGAYRFRYAVPG